MIKNEIKVNAVRCLICGCIVISKHRHDFVKCDCGNVTVDGGTDYLKRSFKDRNGFEELSFYTKQQEREESYV